jgi:regulator of RNase E activity RraB
VTGRKSRLDRLDPAKVEMVPGDISGSPHYSRTLNLVVHPSMIDGYPNDSDGGALRRVVADGSDMSKPMYINFHVAVPSEAAAKALADVVYKLGYRVAVYDSDECSLPWTCEFSTRMLATYEGVIAVQVELAEVSKGFGGYPDGWGTFGNGPNGQYPAS